MAPTPSRLVVFAPNWLGDAVMALPAIAALGRSTTKGAGSLAIAARPAIAPLFSMVSAIDEVVTLDTRRRLPGQYDAAILLPNSFSAALLAWRAGIPERWGYRTDWRGPLLTRAIDPPEPSHQVEYYRRLVSALGLAPSGSSSDPPDLPLTDALRETGVRELKVAGWDGVRPLVALAPGAAYGGAKRWPPPYFAALVNELAEDGMLSVLVGGRADLPVAREIERAASHDVLNLMGTDLPTLAGVLSACRAVVSNDSGAMHLAAAIGVRVTAVFGPTDERLTSPAGEGHVVLTNPVWCRPCMMRECPIDHRCMRGVGVDRVVGALRQML
jgi:lipopolysaccharide heptosyltransferase II